MTYYQFKKQFEALIPCPNEGLTRGWHQFARKCTSASEEPLSDYLEELIRAFTFIGRNFPPDVVQELYLTKADCKALLNSELFWAAMLLQSGRSRQQAGELASRGVFEIGMELPEIPMQPDVLSRLSLFTLHTGGRESYYLTEQSPGSPELLAGAIRQGAADMDISYMEAFARLKRDFTFLPRMCGDACGCDMAFCKVDKEIAKLVGDNFLTGAAIAALVNFDGVTGEFSCQKGENWLRVAQEEQSGLSFGPP